MELKKPLTFEEQVDRLKENGMQIKNIDKVKEILAEINYYRFTGYALQFRKEASQSTYQENTTFEMVYNIYLFDTELRNVIKPFIEKIEVYYRTQIAYGFSVSKCLEKPHDGHYSKENFYNKKGYDKVFESLKREENYNRDSLIVQHHKKKYNDHMPLWVLVELMSFSNLSKFYSCMYYSEKKLIARNSKKNFQTLENHLHCLSVLRNKCAHCARLYDTKFSPPVKLGKATLNKYKEIKNDTIFAYIILLIRNLAHYEDAKELVEKFNSLLDLYSNYVDLKIIGCPNDYKVILESELKYQYK